MKKTTPKIYEPEMRELTLYYLARWYEREVYCNRAEYAEGRRKKAPVSREIPRMTSVDPLAEAKRERPWLWNTTFNRIYESEELNPETGELEKVERLETVSILDTYGPGPTETRVHKPSTSQGRGGIRLEEAAERSARDKEALRVREEVETMRRLHSAMAKLHAAFPTYYLCVRLSTAGYSQRYMADKLKCSKAKVELFFECGLTWLMGCLYHNPVWREDVDEFKQVLQQHHMFRKMPKMQPADLFYSMDSESTNTQSCG